MWARTIGGHLEGLPSEDSRVITAPFLADRPGRNQGECSELSASFL